MPSNFKALAGASGGEPTDANFKNVTLLLHGDGSNGAQNNTFIDSSTNNFTITRNGNTTQGSFSPYGSNWSNYFDGSGDYLTAGNNSAFAFGTGDFTVETWVFPTVNTGGFQIFFDTRNGGGDTAGIVFTIYNNQFGVYRGSLRAFGSVTFNQWAHYAVTRSGGTMRAFINGTQVDTWTDTTTLSSDNSVIGMTNETGNYFNGYLSNLRVLKGTALYTSNFTPSTTPLTAITNTSLLTCQSNRFRDGSTNNFTITRNGDVKVTNFSPFAPSAAYSTTTNGGSAYFDGTGDYLTSGYSTALQFGGDFTVETWVYLNSRINLYPCIVTNYNSYTTNGGFAIFAGHNNNPNKYQVSFNGSFPVLTSSSNVTYGAWTHVALVRSGTTLTLYINGVSEATATSSVTVTGTANNWWIGTAGDSLTDGVINGYVSNLRAVKGTAVYTANFTPPTAPVTAITNTSLLLNATNAAIFDNSMKNDLETVGNAQISTSVKKFGTGSMAFDGSGDNLFSPSTPDMHFGSGNWTIEMWVYVSTRTTNYPLLFGNNRGSWTTDALALTASNADSSPNWTDRFVFGWNNGGFSSVSYGTSQLLVANVTNSTGTWYHFAVVRNGTSVKMYRNGTEVGSATVSSTATFNWGYNGTLMGGGNWDGAASNFNGYLDEVRATKGVARYTSAFTAPTAPFPNK